MTHKHTKNMTAFIDGSFSAKYRTKIPKILFGKISYLVILIISVLCAPIPPSFGQVAEDSFNPYILRAVEELKAKYSGLGYNIDRAYTHTIPYGDEEIVPKSPPETMCVAAVAEVIATALTIYAKETGDTSPLSYLPAVGWKSMRPKDIRSHIWVDPHLDAYGTADALVTFGIGKRVPFGELSPGSFINLNRTTKSGHAVIFMSYIDANGADINDTPPVDLRKVAGFRYFSAQTRNTNGLGYGYAFFSGKDGKNYCPKLPNGIRPDCKVIYTRSQKYLNTGYMFPPKLWNSSIRDKNIYEITQGLYQQTRSRGPSYLGISKDISFENFVDILNSTDTMKLNPLYNNMQD